MSEPASPSPLPRPEQLPQSHLLPSSVFSTPSVSSTLPLPRPTSASGAGRRSSFKKRVRTGSSQRRRYTRSAASSISHSSDGDGSLGDFSMENYTIDLAQLGRKVDGAPMIGAKRASMEGTKEQGTQPAVKARNEDSDENQSDYHDGDYSIDLGDLGEGSSGVTVEDRVLHGDGIPSEDGGPEDFTLNLEKWMRGARKWEKEIYEKESRDDHNPEGDQQQHLQHGSREPVDESVFEPIASSTPAPLNSHAIIGKGVREQAREAAPPMSRVNTEMMQDKAAEEVFDRIAALQAEVETMRIEEENRRLAFQLLEKEHERMKLDHAVAHDQDQSRHRALHEEHEQLQQAHRETQESLRQEKLQLQQNYDNAIEQLQALAHNSPSSQSFKVDQPDTNDDTAAKELKALKAKAEEDQIEAETRIKALESELRSLQDETVELRTEIVTARKVHEVKVKELEAELEMKKNEISLERKESIHRGNEAASLTEIIEQKDNEIYALHGETKAIRMELEHAEEQLTETRRIVEAVEEENDRLMEQNERQADDIAAVKATVKEYADKERMAEQATSSTKKIRQITTARDSECLDKATDEAAFNNLSQEHQKTIDSLETAHGKEIQVLRSALIKASQAMQKREAKLTKAHLVEVRSLEQEVAALKRSAKTPASPDAGLENELRSAIRVLSSKLEKANTSLRSARAEAAEARKKAGDVRDTNVSGNAELEARFAQAVEAREEEWRKRIALMFRERDRMAKVLMWQWGREEVGPNGPNEREQGYRYKYVTREKGLKKNRPFQASSNDVQAT